MKLILFFVILVFVSTLMAKPTKKTKENPKSKRCKCVKLLNLVCASDKKTYINPCELACINKKKRLHLKIVKKGKCGNGRKGKSYVLFWDYLDLNPNVQIF